MKLNSQLSRCAFFFQSTEFCQSQGSEGLRPPERLPCNTSRDRNERPFRNILEVHCALALGTPLTTISSGDRYCALSFSPWLQPSMPRWKEVLWGLSVWTLTCLLWFKKLILDAEWRTKWRKTRACRRPWLPGLSGGCRHCYGLNFVPAPKMICSTPPPVLQNVTSFGSNRVTANRINFS